METLKYTVDRTAKDLDNTRKKAGELKKEVAAKNEKYVQSITLFVCNTHEKHVNLEHNLLFVNSQYLSKQTAERKLKI